MKRSVMEFIFYEDKPTKLKARHPSWNIWGGKELSGNGISLEKQTELQMFLLADGRSVNKQKKTCKCWIILLKYLLVRLGDDDHKVHSSRVEMLRCCGREGPIVMREMYSHYSI